jgi:hypothetical protein
MSSLDIKKLEADIADDFIDSYFKGYRVYHRSKEL